MKKYLIKSLTGLVFASALMSGCDLLDKADDVTLNEKLELTWTIDENLEAENAPYEDFQTLDLSDHPVIKPYLEKIKTIEITKITYHIEAYDASPHNSQVIFVNGTASFGPAGTSIPSLTIPMAGASGVNLQTTTAEVELDIDADGLSEVAQYLKDDHAVKMYTDGILSKTPVAFKVVSTFHAKITANALN